MVSILFSTNTDAFKNQGNEVYRLLSILAARSKCWENGKCYEGKVIDINGKNIGKWEANLNQNK
jgi:hypothetical protein